MEIFNFFFQGLILFFLLFFIGECVCFIYFIFFSLVSVQS